MIFVDTSPPVWTRDVGTQVAQGRRHGRGDALGTWAREQRMFEPKAATHGMREAGDSSAAAEKGARVSADVLEVTSFGCPGRKNTTTRAPWLGVVRV